MNESTGLSKPGFVTGRDDRVSVEKANRADSSLPQVAYEYNHEEEGGLHLRDYWRIVRKHLWLIIGMSLLIPTLVAIYLIRKPDVFEAQARIQVDLESPNSLLGGMSKNNPVILSNETNDPAYFN